MKRSYRYLAGAVAVALATGVFGARAAKAGEEDVIRLARGDGIDKDLFASVAAFVKGNMNLTVTVHDAALKIEAQTTAEQAAHLGRLKKSGECCVVALLNEPAALAGQTVLLGTNAPVAVVNVVSVRNRIQEPPSGSDKDVQMLAWKETMRAIGLVLGLKDCPNPYCAMSTLVPKSGPKVLSCNFCPPCKDKIVAKFPSVAGGERKSK